MRLMSRLAKAEVLAEAACVAEEEEAAREQDRITREYLASLTLDELKALEAAMIWKDADPHRTVELAQLSPDELIALYQQELSGSSGSGEARVR